MRYPLIMILFSSILNADADGGKNAEIQSIPVEETICVTLRDDTIASSVAEEGVIYPIEDFIRIEEEVE